MRNAGLFALLLLCACGGTEPPPVLPTDRARARRKVPPPPRHEQPRKVLIDTIYIGFEGAQNFESLRTATEAAALAKSIYQKVSDGLPWQTLKNEYSDDRSKQGEANGPYIYCNDGVKHNLRRDQIAELPRKNVWKAVADASFSMKKGAFALVEYDKTKCGDGWFVLWRKG